MSEVTSVNGKTGAVVLTPTDVEAVPSSVEGQPNGVATLDPTGVLAVAQLPSSVVRNSLESLQALIGPLSSLYFATSDEQNILVNTSTLAPGPNWTKGGSVGDSGNAIQAAFVHAREARVEDPTGATSLRRGRTAIPFPAGAFYTALPNAMMTAGGNRTVGLRYQGKGKGLTQIVFQPPVGNPRHVLDAKIKTRTLESATVVFTKEDVGHRVLIYQAGTGGGVLDTVITSFVNGTTVEVGIAATTEVSGVACYILADAPLFFNADRWADVQLEGLEFIALQPTESVPSTEVKDGALGVTVTKGAMTVGSTTLIEAGAPFNPDMVGLTVTVAGAGAGKGTLTSKIVTFSSPTTVTLENANASGESITNKSVSIFSNILQLGRALIDGAMTEKTKTLKSATANFTQADLGTFTGVAGAGVGGALLLTTIQSIVSSTEVLVAQECVTTVSGAQLTLGGKTITGKHIGNTVEVEGAGVAGAKLTATVLSIRLRDVNGVPSTEMLLSSPCSTIVAGVATTFNCCVNAIFWRSTSLGGVEGPVARDCIWRGAWAECYCLDGTNQNADVYWDYCKVFDRPGTFLHQLPDPALNNTEDQMVDFSFNRGVFALTYGDLVFFDGRGGFLKIDGGAHTIGGNFAISEDSGGKLPVEVAGTVEDPGGTRFKARDFGIVALNRRHLKITDVNFEQRNNASILYDIAWSTGQVEATNCSDASGHLTNTNTCFARMAFLGVTGPSVIHTACTWKGRHLYRYKNPAWKFPHAVYYRTCDIEQQEAGSKFAICGATDGAVSSVANIPVIHFVDGCRMNTAEGTLGFESQSDTDTNWQTGNGSPIARLRKWMPGSNASGLPGTGNTATMIVPYGCLVVRLQLYVPVIAGQSTNEDWTVTITDNEAHTLHVFEKGADGIAAGAKWNGGLFALVTLATPFLSNSNNGRTLLCKVGGTGTTANHEAFVLAETIG